MAGGIAFFVCPPPADLPAGTAGRSPLGLKIVHLTLQAHERLHRPAGHARLAPQGHAVLARHGAARTPPGAAEAEAEHGTPQQLTLAAKAAGAKRSDVSGRLTLAGKGVAGRTVLILAGGKQVGKAQTNASGAFDTTVALKQPPAMLTAKVVVPARYLAPCAHPAFAPLPCTTSIVAGFATSAHARVAG